MNGGSLLALLEEEDDKELAQANEAPVPVATPASDIDDAGDDDAADDDDLDDDLDAEIDAELEDDDDDEDEDDENTEDEDEGHETDGGPATAATPGPGSAAPTPGAPTPAAEQESDDNKIGEEDLEDEEDITPAAPIPGSVLAAQALEEMAAMASLGGGDLPAEMMTKAKAGQDEGAKETTMSTHDIERMMAERQAMESSLVVHFDTHQQERYERFKRSRLNKANMKKVVDAVAGKPGILANQNVMIALCGVTKMFVGELVEAARIVATSANHFGPLMPVHVYEAYRMLQSEKKCISTPKRARLFK